MKITGYFFGLLIFVLVCLPASLAAKDLDGSRDHSLVKRYEGSEIIRYKHSSFDSIAIPLGPSKNSSALTDSVTIEGAVTQLTYKVPMGRSALEVVRNYENELKGEGFEVLYQGGHENLGPGFAEAAGYRKIQMPPNIPPFYLNEASQQYMVLKRASAEQGDLYVVLFAVEQAFWASDLKDIEKGQAMIQVTVVETKPMEQKMVTVTADEMERQIASSGGVALYGIYFDFNKADLKPESTPTLQEMATFLKSSSAKGFLVVGHTDTVGTYEANLNLSQRRAEAVVNALVNQYGIDRAKLKPVGIAYAGPKASNRTEDGRAKNRRVELVEF